MQAERAGFDELWLSEDYLQRGACTVAGGVAAATTAVTVGIGVVNPWTRHPVLTAMEFAALHELSGGRCVLGLGTSNSRWMSEQLGLDFSQPLTRLAESVELIRAMLGGAPVSHHGRGWDVEARLAFAPFESPPQIVLGVKGPRALRLAGQIADGVLLSVLAAPQYVSWARNQIGALSGCLRGYALFCCLDDAAAARDQVRPVIARFLGMHGEHAITREAGVDPQLARRFRESMLAGRPAVELVTDELVTKLAVAGDREECATQMAALGRAGLDVLILIDDPFQPPAELVRAAWVCWELAGGQCC